MERLVALLALLFCMQVTAQNHALFQEIEISEKPPGIAAKNSGTLKQEKYMKGQRIVRSRGIELDKVDSFTLKLTEGDVFRIDLSEIQRNPNQSVVWQGHVVKNTTTDKVLTTPGTVFLLQDKMRISGVVHIDGTMFKIRSLGDQMYSIVEIDTTELPGLDNDTVNLTTTSADSKAVENVTTNASLPVMTGETIPALRVLVVYTAEAAAVLTGAVIDPAALVMDANTNIAWVNESYDDSGIDNIEQELAAAVALNYSEAEHYAGESAVAYFTKLRNRARENGDGHMDEIHDLRDTYQADVVVLMVIQGGYCGLAHVFADYDDAFAAVGVNCTEFAFAHEIGHLQGAHHDVETDSVNVHFPHGHGYRQTGEFRTVMAYDCSPHCPLEKIWSSPSVFASNGDAAGIINVADNASVLRETAHKYALLYEHNLVTYKPIQGGVLQLLFLD